MKTQNMTDPEMRKESAEVELFLGQGHAAIGNGASYVGHRTFPNTHTSRRLLRQTVGREN